MQTDYAKGSVINFIYSYQTKQMYPFLPKNGIRPSRKKVLIAYFAVIMIGSG